MPSDFSVNYEEVVDDGNDGVIVNYEDVVLVNDDASLTRTTLSSSPVFLLLSHAYLYLAIRSKNLPLIEFSSLRLCQYLFSSSLKSGCI